jgi:hypothetical protein
MTDSTVTRFKDYFTIAHANTYLRRNLTEFCLDISRLNLVTQVPNFNMNLQFLKDPASYDYIITNYLTTFPLLAFRAYTYKKYLNDSTTKQLILKHKQNLEWHLARCYRVRNEIVHDAAIHLNIQSITANLRYYLIFILTGLVQYLADGPQDFNMTGSISIDDYFILQEIKYRGHETNNFNFTKLVDETSITDIFM